MLSQSHLLLQQVRILDPLLGTDRIADVWIADGQIQGIENRIESLPDGAKILDSRGSLLAPGLVDLYSHSGEPGREERETLGSLAAAAASGGFTRVAILPDTIPTIDNPATVTLLQRKAESLRTNASSPSLHFWGALTDNLDGQSMTELAELADSGIVGFSDGRPLENLGLLQRLLEYLHPLGKPIALVPSNLNLAGNGVMREGIESLTYGLPGNPAVSEAAAIAALLEIIAASQTPVHLMRISTRRGVELIADAKARGIPVTASTTWMHLLLDTTDLSNYDPNLRLDPPLGRESDRQALIDGVKQGVIDAIAIDHTPYTYEEKTVPFAEAPPGAIGLELALPLLWQRFVTSGEWTALQLWQALSFAPQQCLHLTPQSLTRLEVSELVLFDPDKSWTVDRQTLQSRSANTPWLEKPLVGRFINL